ncbi:hypothetical protein PR202_ga15253 [Eleusine coracana subsp. coracana]|uniref:Strictosidine synthase conserved region domain-containing protein n=1 Tax=Eleusine coracana subsp. coracana TaxID=191504 RepID=A0AAV5CJP3_ELECO|nr:hypothetical protein PR202_ga15253 [Eleusine coracana subsp. coracana]
MEKTSKLALLAMSLLVMLLVPSTAAARVGPAVMSAINAIQMEHLDLPKLVIGPESVAFDGHGGGPYVSVSDGRILKYGGKDWWRGNRIGTEAAGVPLSFTNGVDVDQVTGDVYFTSSSTTYTRAQHERVTVTKDSTGRIMKYDAHTNQVTVIQSNVTYPNGIAISADRTHLIVASTGPCKLLKVWIEGPKTGSSELFTELPGYPDNVRPDQKGGYWVALHREKFELPFGPDSHLLAVRISANGQKLQDMRGSKGVRPTEVVEKEDGMFSFGNPASPVRRAVSPPSSPPSIKSVPPVRQLETPNIRRYLISSLVI